MEAKLLIVEDDPLSLWAMSDYFRACGLQVASACSRETAEWALTTDQYSLVITDLRLGPDPNLDGLDVVSAAHSGQPDTPVILLTACSTSATIAEAYRRGANRVLDKPQSLPALVGIAVDLIEHGRQ